MAQVIFKDVGKAFPTPLAPQPFWSKKPASGREVWAVKNLNLTIREGEFLVLLGPSGCGKSTTLRMLAGLEEVTRGEIYIGERLVNHIAPKDRDIAMVFQNYALYPHMNVFDNLAFSLKLRKVEREEIKKRVTYAAQMLELGELLERKPKELSGGQRQRVAMGRAIVRNPQVYLMDEPLSNLDAKLRSQMRAELQKIHQTLQVTTVYVTHDQAEAMTLGQRLVLMKNGVVQQTGTPLELYDQPANQFVAGFLGTPPMNFITGRLEEKDNLLYFKTPERDFSLPPQFKAKLTPYLTDELTLGLRPENIYLEAAENPLPCELKAHVETTEMMGNEIILHLKNDSHRLTARVAPDAGLIPGDTVTLYIDLSKAHFFSQEHRISL